MRYSIILCIAAVILSGCGNTVCSDNPRNMQCFTADELQKELGQ